MKFATDPQAASTTRWKTTAKMPPAGGYKVESRRQRRKASIKIQIALRGRVDGGISMSASNSKFDDFIEASHGSYEMAVVTRSNVRSQSPTVIASWAKEAKRPPGKLCISCNTEFAAKGLKPAALLALTPFVPSDAPATAVVSGMYKTCYSTGDLKVKALLSWRKILPDLREIDGGRA
jgi:hypothetical protein